MSEKVQNDAIFLDITSTQQVGSRDDIEFSRPKTLKELNELVNNFLLTFTKVKTTEKSLFLQMLGMMMNAGMPLLEALRMLQKQIKNPRLKKIIFTMKEDIEKGSSLAESMKRHSDVFPVADCSVIEAGEKSGKLYEVIKELVKQYERIEDINKKVMGIMLYPIIVITVMILLTIVLLIFVVPKLEVVFGGKEGLPLPTQMLINGSDFMINSWHWVLLGFITIVFSFNFWRKTPSGRKNFGLMLVYTPKVGGILQKMIISKISRIFGFLLASGVPMYESLRITATISGNYLYKEHLLLAADDLTKGITLAENLADNERLFPEMMVNLVSIGEKTAGLDKILAKISDVYNDELDREISTVSKLMEPVILAIISAGAVFMILAVYLPILQLNDKVVG